MFDRKRQPPARLLLMSDDDENDDWESPVALRAKAAHLIDLATIMGEETRIRLMRIASEYLERAVKLEERQRKGDE